MARNMNTFACRSSLALLFWVFWISALAQENVLPAISIEELKHIVKNDYSSINTISVDYDYARIEAPQGWDNGMCWHDQYIVKGSLLKRNRDSGYLDASGKPNYSFGEIRSWDGEKQWLFRKEDRKGLITHETEHQLVLGNSFFTFAGMSRSDYETPSVVDGSFMDYLNTGLVEIAGVESVNGHLCYRIDYLDKLLQPGAPERVFWIDPGYGYAPIREVLYRGDKSAKPTYEIEVSEMIQVNGFMRWWPKEAIIKWYKQNEADEFFLVEDHFSLNDVKFNPPLNDSDFSVAFPEGTNVEDRIAQLEYNDSAQTANDVLGSIALANKSEKNTVIEKEQRVNNVLGEASSAPTKSMVPGNTADANPNNTQSRQRILIVVLIALATCIVAVVIYKLPRISNS